MAEEEKELTPEQAKAEHARLKEEKKKLQKEQKEQRKAAKEGLLADLAPLFSLLSSGSAIEGLNAYVK